MPLIRSVSGVRGIVDRDCGQHVTLTPEVAHNMGRAFATYVRRQRRPAADQTLRLVGARDGRPGGQQFLDAFAEGAWQSGAQVLPLGIVSTPGTALAAAQMPADLGICGGVVITASHNPQQWNGIKMLLGQGRAPTDAEAQAVFRLLDDGDFDQVHTGTPPLMITLLSEIPDVHDLHVRTVLDQISPAVIQPRRLRVVLDSINGAGAKAGCMLLEQLGCQVETVNAEADRPFARPPEPTAENLDGFRSGVLAAGADVGFAQDPDADRLAIIDERGRYIGEEYTLALAAQHVFATRPGPAVANLSTSRMIDDLAADAGGPCTVHRSAVGEANVVQTMQEVGAHIGGEGNGGVIDPQVVMVRDSLVGMALTLQLMADQDRPLSRIVDDIPAYAIVKEKFEADQPRIARVLDALRHKFADERVNDRDGVRIDWDAGWVHVRGSNTEPIMRIIAEARDEGTARGLIDRVRGVVDTIQ